MRLNTSPFHHPHWRLAAVALAAAILLTACGGGGNSPTSNTDGGIDATVTAFPTGVALSSPASLDNTSSVVASASQAVPMDVRMADWGRTMWQALQNGDTRTATALMLKLLPISAALAAPTKVPEGAVVASEIEAVARGTRPLSHPGLLSINDLFSSGVNNAACFGPGISFTGHDNWAGATMMHPTANGNLPSGDLGMWTASSTDSFGTPPANITQPCAIAQLNKRLDGTKKQVRQAMLLMAGMRRLIQANDTLSMPTAGNSTDVQSALATTLAAIPAMSGMTVDAATVSLNGGGTLYTYRLALSNGSGADAKRGEIVIQHTPGGSLTAFTGVLQVTTSRLGSDANFGCSDETTTVGATPYYRVATVTTTRYNRNGTSLDVGARSGAYCGEPAPASSSHIGDIATLDSDGMLDFSTDLNGNNTRGGVKGWRGDASRFGATLNTSTQAGDFIYLWQAGNLDSLSRAFAVRTAFNSSTEARTLNAYFGYSNPIDSTTANLNLRGMVCNWAGPGNNQTPNTLFQSQSASLISSATTWALDTSKITYAPTTTCNSSAGMNYDVDADMTVAAGEGASVNNDLDTLTGINATVADELISRGVSKPSLF